MKREYKPFSHLAPIEAPASLREAVRARAEALVRRSFYLTVAGLSTLVAVSVATLVASCAYVWSAVAASGFGSYLSFALSDGSALSYAKDLSLSLLESLPAAGLALILAAGLVSIGSLWSFSRVFRLRREVGVAYA